MPAKLPSYTESVLLQGLFVPLLCPFYRDGALYLRKLEHNVARYSLSPAAGLIALMPGGEAGTLTDEEAHQSLHSVAGAATKEKVLVAGVERGSVLAALERIALAERAQFDAVLLAPPPDWARLVHGSADARELLLFYEAVADRSALPIVLWSDSRPPYLQLPAKMIASLARHGNVLGLLDANLTEARLKELRAATEEVQREVTVTPIFEAVTRRMLQPAPSPVIQSLVSVEALSTGSAASSPETVASIAPALKTRTRVVGFQILSGAPLHTAVPLLAAGASALAPTISACAPQAAFEAFAAWKDGDAALATERAARLEAAEACMADLGPAAVKAGCDLNGYFGGQPRLPRLPLTADQRLAVEQSLQFTRN